MHAELGGDGADRPVLSVEEAPARRLVSRWGTRHEALLLRGERRG